MHVDRNALLRDLGPRLTSPLVVVDVGARWGAASRWEPMGDGALVVGFEPDAAECDRLRAIEPGVRYVSAALGAVDGVATLFDTADPACSSLYPPVAGLPALRPGLGVVAPVGTTSVTIARLDTWLASSGLDAVHVMKLDTQGSELDVLRGAERTLRSVRMIEVEVEFNPIYEGQPLFGDVDRYLRDNGFVLWRLGDFAHYGMADVGSDQAVVTERHHYDSRSVAVDGHGGQLFWAHAYYIAADMEQQRVGSAEDSFRDACAVAAFGFMDLAASVLARTVAAT